MMDEAPRLFRLQPVQLLLVPHRTKRRYSQHLRLASSEEPGAVRAGQQTDFGAYGADLVGLSAVRPHTVLDDASANEVLEMAVQGRLQELRRVVLAELLEQLGSRLVHQFSALVLGGGEKVPVA